MPPVETPNFPFPEDDGAAKHLIAGTRLPDVALTATRGASVNLARYQERAVVFVYPMTGTPGVANPPDWDIIPGAHGSTPEAEGFRDAHEEFELLGYEIFGLSSQSPEGQQAFAMRAGIPYLLLSDETLAFADALKLPRFETGGATYLKRLTMIIRNGVIYRVIYPVQAPATHAQELLASLRPARA
ncbi:peroxiredoxin [Hyphomicrobium sp. ghe19]|uniref:peroxiredoxin n=1 Tax=Hyphomicrobium sp. ghe19 TaxID=2682968 RepID=UPI001366B773|nr:Putative peroxiredoxin bcp [Hyphomicrobium sp. ghe19]